jgi:hypothetical protein
MNIEEKIVAQAGTGVSISASVPNPICKLVRGSPVVNSAGMNPQA